MLEKIIRITICLLCEYTLSLYCRNSFVSLEESSCSHRTSWESLLTVATVNISLLSTSTGVYSELPRVPLKLIIACTLVEATPPSI